MHDPDDGAPGSSDDWEITLSPSISSLSSFAPEDFSLPLQQHLAGQPNPNPKPHRASPPQQQQHHEHNHQPRDQPRNTDQSRQKQRTPPLKNPRLAAYQTHHSQPQISIPITNLHTPPPTSPRRKLPSLLTRSSSSPGVTGTGTGGGSRAGITSPPNMNHTHTHTHTNPNNTNIDPRTTTSRNTNYSRASNSRNTNTSRASSRSGAALPGGLRLHTGMGTGRGVGLGAGLPVSPLPAPSPGSGSSFLQRGFGFALGLGGQRFVSGSGTASGTGSGFSPLRAAPGTHAPVAARGEEEEESPSRSLSQSWSDLAGEEVGEEGGGDDDFVGRDSQRHSWDSVATVREEQQQLGRHGRYYEQGDADDEEDGSNTNTHVGEGSDGYKDGQEYGGFQGREGSGDAHEYPASPEYADTRRYEDSGEYEGGMRREDHESRQEKTGFHEYESDGQEEERLVDGDIVGIRTGDNEGEIDDRELQEQGNSDETRDAEHTAETQDTEGDTLPPGRVMLMERLCDLVQRLSSVRVGGGMEADVIDVLNAKVDEMEDLLVLAEETAEAEATADVGAHVEAEGQPEGQEGNQAEDYAEDHAEDQAEAEAEALDMEPSQEEDAGIEGDAQEAQLGEADNWASGMSPAMLPVPLLQVDDQDIRDLASPLPWLTTSFKYSDLSISPTQSNPELAAATNEALEAAKQAAQAQHDMAERMAFEADKLNRELAEVVKRLQARKEESDHLHSLLIDRAEAAATRILDLEQEIVDLEDDILANESELRHLRLKLRAVETVVAPRASADPELVRSIDNWKADWVLVRDRMLERKKDRKDRRLRLHRAGCVISSLEEKEGTETVTTLTSLGGLSMSVSLLGLGGRSPRKGR